MNFDARRQLGDTYYMSEQQRQVSEKFLFWLACGVLSAVVLIAGITALFTWKTEWGNNRWQTDEQGTCYLIGGRDKAVGFYTVGRKDYYFSKDGILQTGWITDAGKRYYADADGVLQQGKITVAGASYWLDDTHAVQTGWIRHQKKTYYADENGILQNGMQTIDYKKYLFGQDHAMCLGWQTVQEDD